MKSKSIFLLLAVLCCCAFAGDRTPAPVIGKDKVTKRKTDRPVYSKLTFVPGFAGSSFYFPDADGKKIEVSFRKAGEGEYKPVLTPSYNRREKLWRGSIVNLEENTCYEVKITKNGKTVATGKFTTMGAPVKIARTIVLNEKNFNGTLEISAKGKPDGWIRYTCAPGFVLTNDRTKPLIILKKAQYVLFENLVLRGGGHNAVAVNYCSNIRFVNCDISGWGRLNTKLDFETLGGKPGYYEPSLKRIWSANYMAGISLNFGDNVVVDKCYIHDPASHSNSWRHSHPAGACAVFVNCTRSVTLRYNDLVANDHGRWNDAVEGLYNFNEDGGFNRDAEIYGNFMIFCQDDNIELDGGQQNVRCFGNRFEASYCGVSIQGCMSGPCYVFNNMFLNTGDEFGSRGQNIKTSTKSSGLDAIAYVLNNSFCGPGTGFHMNQYLKAVVMNNAYDQSYVYGSKEMKKMKSVSDCNVMPKVEDGLPGKNGKFADPGYRCTTGAVLEPAENSPLKGAGAVIPNFTAESDVNIGAFQKGTILPLRPIPVKTSVNRLQFDVKNGKAASQQFTVTVCGNNYKSSFKVEKTKSCDWFEVTPASGTFESGKKITFTVKLDPSKMTKQSTYRGAFLLRQKDGLSRPLSIYATTDFIQPAKLHKPGDVAIYFNAEDYTVAGGKVEVIEDANADGGKALKMYQGKKPFEYKFTVPADGKYHLMVRARSGHRPRVQVAIDDGKLADAGLHIMKFWSWSNVRNGEKYKGNPWSWKVGSFDLTAGEHTLKFKPLGWKDVDMFVLTDNPSAYDPR